MKLYQEGVNYGFGYATLWLVFMFEKVIEVAGKGDRTRVIVDGYDLSNPIPGSLQETDPIITIKQITFSNLTNPSFGGSVSTAMRTKRIYEFGVAVSGDQGNFYNLWLYHYWNGSPQWVAWNEEFVSLTGQKTPEFGGDKMFQIGKEDRYAVGMGWFVKFLYTDEFAPSQLNLTGVVIPDNAVIARYENDDNSD